MKQMQIGLRDFFFLLSKVTNPVHQSAPVASAVHNHGKVTNLTCLNKSERLKQLVECAEAPGENDECLAVFHEHHLTNEEVFELQRQRLVGIAFLFEG